MRVVGWRLPIAEGASRIEPYHLASAGRDLGPCGHDPEVVLDVTGAELGLRQTDPVLLFHQRDRDDVQSGVGCDDRGRCCGRACLVGEERADAGAPPSGGGGNAGLVEHRLLGVTARVGVLDRDRERVELVREDVAHPVDRSRRNEEREGVHARPQRLCWSSQPSR
jgi:hypothetical protein